jgi:hypothetical protein
MRRMVLRMRTILSSTGPVTSSRCSRNSSCIHQQDTMTQHDFSGGVLVCGLLCRHSCKCCIMLGGVPACIACVRKAAPRLPLRLHRHLSLAQLVHKHTNKLKPQLPVHSLRLNCSRHQGKTAVQKVPARADPRPFWLRVCSGSLVEVQCWR